MTPVETLQGMRDLLANPARWRQGRRAANARGEFVNPTSVLAVCWCIVGAYEKVTKPPNAYVEEHPTTVYSAFESDPAGVYLQAQVKTEGPSVNAWSFNDSHTHPEVIGLIDAAISNAKKDANV